MWSGLISRRSTSRVRRPRSLRPRRIRKALLGLADVFAIELHLESVDPLKAAIAFDRGGCLPLPADDFVIAIVGSDIGQRWALRRSAFAQRAVVTVGQDRDV